VNAINTVSSKVISALLAIAAVPMALFMGRAVAQGNFKMVALVFAVGVLFILVFGMANWLWILAVASIFIPGQITILPLPLRPSELLLCLVIARFFVDNIIFRKQWFRIGPSPDWIFLGGLVAVLLVHAYNDRFAMRFFGSDIWGGRQYVAILVSVLAYSVVQSTNLDAKLFRWLPTVALLFGAFDFFMMAVTQLVPGSAQLLWNIYTGVSLSDTSNAMASRWGFMGNFGYLVLYWSLSDCRINEFVSKGKFIKGAAFLLGIAMCVASGYRSSVAVAAAIVIVAAFRDFGVRGIFGLFPLVLGLALIMVLQTVGVPIPKQVQRGLTFLPGGWDADVVLDAGGSMDFRGEIWDMWKETQFPQHPILGRGFGLSSDQMMATQPFTTVMDIGASISYARNEAFVISGNIHNGFYSVIDRFGIIGLIFFTLWTSVVLWRICGYLVKSRNKPLNPALNWLALYIVPYTLGFWPGALKVEQFLVPQLFLVGLFWALLRMEKEAKERPREISPETVPNLIDPPAQRPLASLHR